MLSDKEILKDAKKRYDYCSTQWGEYKQRCTELLDFISGNQWTYTARQNFENAGYTAMTSNRIPTFLRQITNEIRKNTPEIQIDPRSDGQEQVAEAINDLIRNIQEESQAEIAYCTAAESAASIGIGYMRVISEYKDENSFDQILRIEAIEDANMVMIDPDHRSLTGCDSEYGFITTALSKEEYRQRYGDSKLRKRIDGEMTDKEFDDLGWTAADTKWMSEDQIYIIEYYFKDYKPETLFQIMDTVTGAITTTYDKKLAKAEGIEIIQEREVMRPVVRWCKLNDLEVLEKSEWPGHYIPIIAVKGDEYWVDGKRKLVGAVEPAVEAQVQLNYAMSWRAQLLQMAPKAPYIGTADQFKTYEQEWANINVSNQAFLTYNKDDGAPPPSRDLGEVPIQSASVLVQQSEEDLKAIFGTFDPANQTVAPESGKAILARQHQAYNSNYHFYDNLARSIQQVGCVIVEALPVIYDSARDVQLKAQDGKKRTISINQPNAAGVIEYDLTQGDYSVSIQTGPSFGTKRQESAESVMELISVYPQAAVAIADIAVRNMDWPGAQKIADSLEALVPPQVLQARKTDPKDAAAMIPSLQAQLAALKQQNEVMTMQLQEAAKKLNESADKVHIEQMKAEVDMRKIDTETALKVKEMELREQETELEFLVKEQELKIAQMELDLQRAQLGIKGAEVMSDINDRMHDKEVSHIERVATATPGTGEISIGELKTPGLDKISNSIKASARTGLQGDTLE